VTSIGASTRSRRRQLTSSDAIRPGRTGAQTATARTLFVSGAAVTLFLASLGVGAWFVPLVAFFAVGAGAGHSLSGSV